MTLPRKPFDLLKTDWLIAFFLLLIFLLTNGYKYGWDDQHLEIPLLKSLIDPTLYAGDYYVDSLRKNFTTWFFPLLARIITVDQIPAAYFILYLLSRYFLFFWLYKIWKTVSGEKLSAFLCVAMFILIGRVSEFLYRTFSHQEFALAMIFAGVYYFYKERFVLASVILGAAANVHALYSLFPMMYIGIFLLANVRQYGWKKLFTASLGFIAGALPFLFWIFKKIPASYGGNNHPLLDDWVSFYLVTCPQNFIFLDIPLPAIAHSFKVFLIASQKYLLILSLFLLNFVHYEKFRRDKKVLTVALTTLILMGISFYGTYVRPSRFVLDLNLVRNVQFLLLFLMGYTTLFVVQTVREQKPWIAMSAGLMLALLGYGDLIAALAALALLFLVSGDRALQKERKSGRAVLSVLYFSSALATIASMLVVLLSSRLSLNRIAVFKYSPEILFKLAFTVVLILAVLVLVWIRSRIQQKKEDAAFLFFIFIPLAMAFIYYCQLHWNHLKIEREGGGFWQLQREWEDMQVFAQKNTPKDALFLVPNNMEMGGFRILSERKLICCYRDCGIVGFDYKAALEWKQRLADIEPFKVILDKPIKPALLNALFKYHADYIVFMRYYAPAASSSSLEKIYENGGFVLFKVKFDTYSPESFEKAL